MPEFIEPLVERVLAVLQARTPAILAMRNLPEIADWGRQWSGVFGALPAVRVSASQTQFDAEQTLFSHAAHAVKIKFAVGGSEPDEVHDAAVRYMRAIHEALAASWPGDWSATLDNGTVVRLFVSTHDYGPLFEGSAGLAKFPEMELVIETQESWGGLEGV